MIDLFTSYLNHACPAAFETPIEGVLAAELHKHKVLLTLATLPEGVELGVETQAFVADETARILCLRSLGQDIVDQSEGSVQIVKGSRYASLYPDGVFRFQGDLDLLIEDEATYIACLKRLFDAGFIQKASHLTQAKDGGVYASTILFEPEQGNMSGPKSLFVELHLRAFPVTPLSYLNMVDAAHVVLKEEVRSALTLLAEFPHRYAKVQHFTHRDVLDTLLIFSRLHVDDVYSLSGAVSKHFLWSGVALLRRHLRQVKVPKLPESIVILFADARVDVNVEDFDLFEHQAWPYCQSEGRSREEYEFLHSAYGQINTANGEPTTLSDFEVGMCFGRGVPVAIRLDVSNQGSTLLDTCVVLAGPTTARKIVHQRIGESSPIGPN